MSKDDTWEEYDEPEEGFYRINSPLILSLWTEKDWERDKAYKAKMKPVWDALDQEEEREARQNIIDSAYGFYQYYPWKRLSMMFLNMIISATFLSILIN